MTTLAREVLTWHSLHLWFCYKRWINSTYLYMQATITTEFRGNCLSVHSLKYKLTFGLHSVQFIARKNSTLYWSLDTRIEHECSISIKIILRISHSGSQFMIHILGQNLPVYLKTSACQLA